MKEKLVVEEEKKERLIADKKTMDVESSAVRGELSDLEVTVGKAEQERSTKDHVIRSINDDINSRFVGLESVTRH
jgi:myosin heavy chain 6/7